jgi:arsenate reductase
MIKIYHNPRCTKSRQGLKYLQEKGLDFEVVEYLKEGLKEEELESILTKLNFSPMDLIRKNEAIWKSDFKAKVNLTDQQVILAMVQHPKLMERPIVINGDKAAVGRPTENIESVF